MPPTSLAHFTPSMNDPALLEAVFTAREPLAQQLMSRIADSVDGQTRHYSIIVGPRGAGKTHLVSLLYYRVKRDPVLAEKLRIAWLPEDPWQVGSYALLLKEILLQLDREYGVPGLPTLLDQVIKLTRKADRERAFERALVQFLGDRVLLLVAENLDDILIALKDDGQKKLRALLQTSGRATLLATSTSLLPAITERDKAFYAFFTQYALPPFSLHECVDVLLHIARYTGDTALADFLQLSAGTARVRAIHHIAGGNPRIYVVFYQFLTRETLDELATAFMRLVQELTPYYQGRMQTLSHQQRGIVDVIRRSEGPIAVRDIAKETLSTSQSISSDLARLKNLGYVDSNRVGRESLYELREPLMRICLATKEQRGTTIPLFVEFLRAWFTQSELEQMRGAMPIGSTDGAYYEAAIKESNERQALAQRFERQKIQACLDEADEDLALAYLDRALVRSPNDAWAWDRFTHLLEKRGELATGTDRLTAHVAEFPDDASAWSRLSYFLALHGDSAAALGASSRALDLVPNEPSVLLAHLRLLEYSGQEAQARELAQRAATLPESTEDPTYQLLMGAAASAMENPDAAIDAYSKALLLSPIDAAAWELLGEALARAGRNSQARLLSDVAIEMLPSNARIWRDRSYSLFRVGAYEEGFAAMQKASLLAPNDADIQVGLLMYHVRASRLKEANELAQRLRAKDPAPALESCICEELAHLALIQGDADAARTQLERGIYLFRQSKRFVLPWPVWVVQRSHAPETWRPYVEVWLKVFREHEMLEELAQMLLRPLLRYPHLWLTPDLAANWVATWQSAGADVPELKISLDLMTTVVRFMTTRSRDVLVTLSLEQRSLLEPELQRYLRASGDLVDDVDRNVERLAATLRQRSRAQTGRLRAVERKTMARLDEADVDAFLAPYSDRTVVEPLRPLLFGGWTALTRAEARELLLGLTHTESTLAAVIARGDLRLQKLERRPLINSAWSLYQAHVLLSGRQGAVDFCSNGHETTLVDEANVLLELVHARAIDIRDDAAAEYVGLYSSIVRAEGGRFELADTADPEVSQALAGTATERVPNPRRASDAPDVYVAYLAYFEHLFEARFSLTPEGRIAMTDDQPIGKIPLRAESYDGPIRLWREDNPR